MSESLVSSGSYRRGVRHEVELPCELVTPHSDSPLLIWATDLSRVGAWLETPEPLAQGDDVVLCFQPLCGWSGGELQVFAQVQRAERRMGPSGARSLGMALEFLDLTPSERVQLSAWLAPRPLPTFKPPSRFKSLGALLH